MEEVILPDKIENPSTEAFHLKVRLILCNYGNEISFLHSSDSVRSK